jgi:hypothetical protein
MVSWMRLICRIAPAGALLCGGCLINSSTTKVVRPDEPQVEVKFTSETARKTFDDAQKARYAAGYGKVSSSWLGVPFIVGASEKQVLSEHAFYNDQVHHADTSHNGLINEAEAEAYAHPRP